VRAEDSPAAAGVDVAENFGVPGFSAAFGACLWFFPWDHFECSFGLNSRGVSDELSHVSFALRFQESEYSFRGGLNVGEGVFVVNKRRRRLASAAGLPFFFVPVFVFGVCFAFLFFFLQVFSPHHGYRAPYNSHV
jgi:hypothetical protein